MNLKETQESANHLDEVKELSIHDLQKSASMKANAENELKSTGSQSKCSSDKSEQSDSNRKSDDNQVTYDVSAFSKIFRQVIEGVADGKPALQIDSSKSTADFTYQAYVDSRIVKIAKDDGGLYDKQFVAHFKENIIYLNKKPLSSTKQVSEFESLLGLISEDLVNDNAKFLILDSVKELQICH